MEMQGLFFFVFLFLVSFPEYAHVVFICQPSSLCLFLSLFLCLNWICWMGLFGIQVLWGNWWCSLDKLQRCCCSNKRQSIGKKEEWVGEEVVGRHSDLMPGAPKWFLPLGLLCLSSSWAAVYQCPQKVYWEGCYSSLLASIPRQQSISPTLLSPLLLSASISTSICLPLHILWQNRGRNSVTHILSLSLFAPS